MKARPGQNHDLAGMLEDDRFRNFVDRGIRWTQARKDAVSKGARNHRVRTSLKRQEPDPMTTPEEFLQKAEQCRRLARCITAPDDPSIRALEKPARDWRPRRLMQKQKPPNKIAALATLRAG
jgi:hypothetical protein